VTIAFYLPGGVPVYAFSLILGLGAALGLLWVAWRAPAKMLIPRLDAGLLVLLGGLLGGRAVFVAIQWFYYQSHLLEILAIHRGGFSWAGALAGGLLALLLVAAFTRTPPGELADNLMPLLASLAVAAWLACWLDGCAYGPRTDQWWGLPAVNEWGQLYTRIPTQLLGAVLTLVLFWLLDWFHSRLEARRQPPRPGIFALLDLLALSLLMFALSYLRVDYTVLLYGLRLEAWAALGFAALAGIALLFMLLAGWLSSRGSVKSPGILE
jgi:phosphatidylglycerol:prolipoprotein diacylglycerol transferase